MSRNLSRETPESRILREIAELRRMVRELKTNQLSVLIVPRLSSDPSSPVDGQVWLNTTGNQLKARINGVTRVVNVT